MLLAAAVPVDASGVESLKASGCSVSVLGYLNELAKQYERKTGVSVFVRSGGSVLGLEELKTGAVDFAASCRGAIPDDPEGIEFIQVAWDALVFIVHPSNPVDTITIEQARGINFGSIRRWTELGGRDAAIKLFLSRPRKGLSGVESTTRSLILGNKRPHETSDTTAVASTGIVEQMVEKTPDGFAVTGYSSAIRRKVKMLKVSGVAPNKQTIAAGKYPFRRPLYFVVAKSQSEELKKFVDYALSAEGQEFIGSLGIITLKEVK